MRPFAVLALGLALAACGSGAPGVDDAGANHERDATTDARATDTHDAAAGYDDAGPCQPGLPRCAGDFGYQVCQQDGTWGSSQSCAGY